MNLLLPTVQDFEIQKLLGVWYEIARLPTDFEPDDCTDVSTVYSLENNRHLRVDNRCRNTEGQVLHAIGHAKIVDAAHGKLDLTFLPEGFRWIPFLNSPYWVFKVDQDYETILLGNPNLKSLWILSRDTTIARDRLRDYQLHAKNLGFDLDDLIYTLHTAKPTMQDSSV